MRLIAICYAAWALAGLIYGAVPLIALPLLALAILLHSSLQHEAIHRHPTASAVWNEALVWLPLGVIVPYRRFREQHLLHHVDERLTDPYDDPESFYIAASDWQRLPRWLRGVLALNNLLVIRMLIGPAVSTVFFLRAEARALFHQSPDRASMRAAWAQHLIGLLALGLIVHFVFAMPVWVYAGAAYLARSILAVRSYCEHQWAEQPGARTVIVEKSLLGWLFLNNNLHIVHHTHPALPWYALRTAYAERREAWQIANGGYVFKGYGAVLRAFAFRMKEQVRHPVRSDR